MDTISRYVRAGIAATCLSLVFAGCAEIADPLTSAPAPAAPLLATTNGPVQGTIEGENGRVAVFRGVRYGASTEGRRFQRAVAPQPWTRMRDATDFGNDCPQPPMGDVPVFASWANDQADSEDCLFLNIWTPGLSDGGKRPIMVWLHGGGYTTGSGSSHAYDGSRLAMRGDVVVVTVNHRLNAFGYTHLGEITDDPKYADAGNLGSLDAILALQWVRDNAAAIGGDANNVTIFGESGGAAKVSSLMAMPAADGLFHRAIAQSGSMSLNGFPIDMADGLARSLMETAGVSSVKELAELPMDALVRAMIASRSRGGLYRPVVDGRSLPRDPFDPDAPAISADVPLLVGTNNNELRLQGGLGDPAAFSLTWEQLTPRIARLVGADRAQELIAGMRAAHPDYDAADVYFQTITFGTYRSTALAQAERKSAAGGAPVYMYRLDWESPVMGGRLGAAHALDIAFVFDNVARSASYTGPETAETQVLANLMADAWIAFARTGNPNTPALPMWTPYSERDRGTMVFDVETEFVQDPDSMERVLLQRLLPAGRPLR